MEFIGQTTRVYQAEHYFFLVTTVETNSIPTFKQMKSECPRHLDSHLYVAVILLIFSGLSRVSWPKH